mgnify:FL=1
MNMNDYNNTPSRVRKNANLYKRIDAANIDEIEPKTDEEVIESNTTTIDVEKLKSMLDKKYRDPSSHTLKDVNHKPVDREINLEETREYNLDDILNKAKDNDETDYGVERLKKLSDTNVSILDGLNIKENDKSSKLEEKNVNNQSKVSSDSKKLIELIDTINLKEQEGYDALLKENSDNYKESNDLLDDLDLEDTSSNEPMDMLSELTGNDDDTKVVGAKVKDNDLDDTIARLDDKEDKYDDIDLDHTDDEFDTTEVVSRDDTSEFTDSIELTTTQIFTKDDFDDFDDLKEATKPRIFVKILIFLIVIAVIIGTVFVLDRILDLGILSRLGINF